MMTIPPLPPTTPHHTRTGQGTLKYLHFRVNMFWSGHLDCCYPLDAVQCNGVMVHPSYVIEHLQLLHPDNTRRAVMTWKVE